MPCHMRMPAGGIDWAKAKAGSQYRQFYTI
nr:MAG TPA: hypothetical protein [Caudoviricetes sp.]